MGEGVGEGGEGGRSRRERGKGGMEEKRREEKGIGGRKVGRGGRKEREGLNTIRHVETRKEKEKSKSCVVVVSC